ISKMGITTAEGYHGAGLFEAVGFGPELMEFLGDFPSRVGGIGLNELVEDARWRLAPAEKMTVLGRHRGYHALNAKVRMALRKAATFGAGTEAEYAQGEEDPGPKLEAVSLQKLTPAYNDFTSLVNNRVPTCLRDLFLIKGHGTKPVSVENVQPAL